MCVMRQTQLGECSILSVAAVYDRRTLPRSSGDAHRPPLQFFATWPQGQDNGQTGVGFGLANASVEIPMISFAEQAGLIDEKDKFRWLYWPVLRSSCLCRIK